jgi:AAA domain
MTAAPNFDPHEFTEELRRKREKEEEEERAKRANGPAGQAQTGGQQQPEPDTFPVDTITSIMAETSRLTLVKGFAGCGELILFYGPQKQGKTFLVSHFAISVVVQAAWFGRKCKAPEGFALYCALEGGAGMQQRLKAILQHDPALGNRITDQNLIVIRKRIDVRQPGDVAKLLATIAKHEQKTGLKCLLVVIDTLARALGSGSDTDPKDMAAMICAADTVRQAGSKPTVALVHHSGKDISRGPRGRSDLPGAIDTCILVERLENGAGNRATCEYAKDDPDGWAIDFTLQQVEVGLDEDGDPITTCVVREGEAHKFAPEKSKQGKKQYQGGRQRIFLGQLRKLARRHPEGVERSTLRSAFLLELSTELERDGSATLSAANGAQVFRQTLERLRNRTPALIIEEDGLFWPVDNA